MFIDTRQVRTLKTIFKFKINQIELRIQIIKLPIRGSHHSRCGTPGRRCHTRCRLWPYPPRSRSRSRPPRRGWWRRRQSRRSPHLRRRGSTRWSIERLETMLEFKWESFLSVRLDLKGVTELWQLKRDHQHLISNQNCTTFQTMIKLITQTK